MNQVFMLRIKAGSESNSIFLGAPDRILDPLYQKMTAKIDSISDKVYLEFYDVLEEQTFNLKNADMKETKNLKLLALHVFDVKDFAFDKNGVATAHRVLMPV